MKSPGYGVESTDPLEKQGRSLNGIGGGGRQRIETKQVVHGIVIPGQPHHEVQGSPAAIGDK